MTFTLNKKEDETFELSMMCNMSDKPFILERSDDYHKLYKMKWNLDEESDNFEVYTVSVVKKFQYETTK